MIDEIKLKPCPRCKAGVSIIRAHGAKWVSCRCGIQSSRYGEHIDEKRVVADWNRRPIEDAQAKRIAELEAERDNCKAALDEALSYLKLEGKHYKSPIERLKKFLVGEPPAINPYPIDPDNMCPYCCGTGQTHGKICDVCHGTGKDHPENEDKL